MYSEKHFFCYHAKNLQTTQSLDFDHATPRLLNWIRLLKYRVPLSRKKYCTLKKIKVSCPFLIILKSKICTYFRFYSTKCHKITPLPGANKASYLGGFISSFHFLYKMCRYGIFSPVSPDSLI